MFAITQGPALRPLSRRPSPPRRRVPKNPLSRAAANERLYRERRRRGAIVIQRLVLSPAAIDGLVSLGWLPEADRGDRERGRRRVRRFYQTGARTRPLSNVLIGTGG